MVSLIPYENRHIIKTGLSNINNPFLKGMVEKNKFMIKNEELTPTDVAFSIAPYINAICRSGTQEEKEIVFNSLLDFKAYTSVPCTKRGGCGDSDEETVLEQALRICANVKSKQNKEKDKMKQIIYNKIKTEHIGDFDNFVMVILDKEIGNRNLNGLVANEIVADYQKPAMVLIDNGEIISGSCRGVNGSGLDNLRLAMESTEEIIEAQGQPNACSLVLEPDNVENFKDSLNFILSKFNFSQVYNVDIEFSANNINNNTLLEIADLKPYWGQMIPESLIAVKRLKVNMDSLILMSPDKKPTLKFKGKNIDFIKFKSNEDEYLKLLDLIGEGYIIIDLVGTVNRNEWNGNVSPQIIIKEYEIVEMMPYEF